MTYQEQVHKFIDFLEARPACNRKCTVDANCTSIKYELVHAKYLSVATQVDLAFILYRNNYTSINTTITNLKEHLDDYNTRND